MKLEAKIKEEEILKQKMKMMEEIEDTSERGHSGKEELNHAENVLRRNSSFVEMN